MPIVRLVPDLLVVICPQENIDAAVEVRILMSCHFTALPMQDMHGSQLVTARKQGLYECFLVLGLCAGCEWAQPDCEWAQPWHGQVQRYVAQLCTPKAAQSGSSNTPSRKRRKLSQGASPAFPQASPATGPRLGTPARQTPGSQVKLDHIHVIAPKGMDIVRRTLPLPPGVKTIEHMSWVDLHQIAEAFKV